MTPRRAKIALWIFGSLVAIEGIALVWQQLELVRYRDSRPVGRVLTLTADLPVLLATNGERLFTIPRGCRIQESTPRGLATPLDYAAPEYILVLRAGGGPSGPAFIGPPGGWMDDYVVRKIEAR